MARVSIYVPDDLKTRMDEVGDAVNWSEIARPAFQAVVANHEHRKGQNMITAIERLRASKQETVQSDRLAGHQDGRAWAEGTATYGDLRRLSRIEFPHDDYDGAYNALSNALDEKRELNRAELLGYCFGDEAAEVTEEYIGAFIEGAKEFFEEVRDQL
jgi:hypothetical protein